MSAASGAKVLLLYGFVIRTGVEINISQSWTYPKSHPKGKPIFFENGKRVSLKRGFELTLDGKLGDAQHLKSWFYDNGFTEDHRDLGTV